MALEAIVTDLAGATMWLDVRAESTATSTIGTYRLALTTSNTVQLTKRASGATSQTLGAAVALPGGGTWTGTHRVRVEVSDVSAGVLLKVYMDGTEAASYTDRTSPITTGNFGRITTPQNVTGYQIDAAVWSAAA
ncbi:hypothetical protein C5E02_04830 [Rathayibacter rathayi]|uniref:LamG domain-containing protein n=1 Tax=Rathayibacter rathayi TaxID=33887 RepID=A0ABD6W9M4_RATRA|nr:hypothetical protein [Rathayibacter rathayi]PPF14457.1 hypothetical protein C5C04_06760 [Rathayibacter rathayi]PPG14990.1 hypothetical protein C5C11_03565 [Rathayibacter rathayi]PPG46971.1 hypothetical protein C5C20_01705 [Rathayibacter rathayi]PPG89936.1 hypothetical protein C5C47_02705 [Rathayibacter rathayi]PPG96706.1 hypothetical protein C5C00_07920 [Rathayibacter rathayi]